MEKTVAKVVDEVPWDIDGTCKYIVQCCLENWLNKTKDGWYFHLRTTARIQTLRKGLDIARGHLSAKKKTAISVHMKIP